MIAVQQASPSVRANPWPAVVGLFFWHLPRNILIVLLTVYRRIVSPLYGQVCRFFPSCSAYALEAVTVHGAVKGSWLAARRLVRCHPWNSGGIDAVPTPAHTHWDEMSKVPYIVMLNHPDKFLAAQQDTKSRPAA